MNTTADCSAVTIRAFQPQTADAASFASLNKEWITRYFALEPRDLESLDNPEGNIVERGGSILMAEQDGTVVGCVALVPMPNNVFELSKMAVSPAQRGRGIGRLLLQAAVEHARVLGASSLFLGSNTRLANAVHLYESIGFTHVPPERQPPSAYTRANVFMEMELD